MTLFKCYFFTTIALLIAYTWACEDTDHVAFIMLFIFWHVIWLLSTAVLWLIQQVSSNKKLEKIDPGGIDHDFGK